MVCHLLKIAGELQGAMKNEQNQPGGEVEEESGRNQRNRDEIEENEENRGK